MVRNGLGSDTVAAPRSPIEPVAPFRGILSGSGILFVVIKTAPTIYAQSVGVQDDSSEKTNEGDSRPCNWRPGGNAN
jgi:hypothetical protein